MTDASTSKVKADSLLPPAKVPTQNGAASTSSSSNANLSTQHAVDLPTQADAERLGFNVFSHLLDPRLLRSLADLGFGIPTPIQQKSIPLALAGKDILARARTGSGKTLAYALPILQKVLDAKSSIAKSDPSYQLTRALVLVPTRELAEQVFRQLSAVIEYVREDIRLVNVARDAGEKVQRLLLSEKPDVVIATPSKALSYLQNGSLDLKSGMESLAIDEADLILSYGHDSDVKSLLLGGGNYLPSHFQSFLMSATMTSDVTKLKGLLLRNPVILKLNEEDESTSSNLVQFYTKTSEEDKFLLVYVILKLKLIRGKAILFVNELERGYRLKLFLEKFGLRACVLNAELPINSRYSIVEEFNKGRFDYIVATDEPTGLATGGDEESDDEEAEEEEEEEEASDVDGEAAAEEGSSKKRKSDKDTGKKASKKPKQSQRKSKTSSGGEYGVSRGVDFLNVSCVINFDLPPTVDSYIHRVGRTARGGASGTSLSFVVPSSEVGRSKYLTCPSTYADEKVFKRISRSTSAIGGTLQEWNYDASSVEGFRYRVGDTLKSITKALIREARIKELKTEILTSTKLQSHFEDHPDDLSYLQHDKALLNSRAQQAHLKHVPHYLVPKIINPNSKLNNTGASGSYKGYVPKNKQSDTAKGRSSTNKGNVAGKGRKKVDPLRKFSKK
ncbi:probable ATP dependent RNA helicase of the DEAD-box family [Ustilago trichophora]|uniref:RNA helicase n=1 Tax=Ustilago trichophora TaxID=86804 RepID=A0A5C3EIN6_9BASI|nr:probable ATP dependent RNA helicase of the DEAD-box family [Ustilago trichophora]